MAVSALPADAIVQAETYYLPPPPRRGQPAQDWSQVPGAELVYRWAEYRLSRRVSVPTASVPDHPGLYARIDDGRWLAECDACRAAWIVSVLDPRFGCVECKRDWVPLIVPTDIPAAEAEALAQGLSRFWWHPDDPRNPYAPEPPIEPEPPVEPDPEVPQP
ncbi:hypothetical protein AMK17_25395 [Streptomyces sp. CB00072]|uniref:hypothetical protein n=1 Tax=Streptomyces sp. CB00072 TaxID=1703928 RepID=UPI00093D3B55|nr:hypothetical protein [Streptomyces sp. CB00072]OKI54335.1 hypothetical protein AMK17_25395 [Streptomyces sp. CB00072]